MSLIHPKGKIYIRFLRIIELIIIFPVVIVLSFTFLKIKDIPNFIKDTLKHWLAWFKKAQDFEYH